MTNSPIPDLSVVASPPRRSISYADIQTDDPIGAGGNAVVYKMNLPDSSPPDSIALKEPQTDMSTISRDTIKQFFEEAETWKKLDRYEREKPRWTDSEHIVGILDSGNELPWIAMEYMDGGSLQDRLNTFSGGLPLDEALWVGECICRGIELAHNYGIAHLDLKPANVLFRETPGDTWDVPKLGDWGLARLLAKETGALEGLSVKYAAPEQFKPDEFGDPDMLTDIYQAGAIVYTLVTGKPPHTGSQATIMYDVVHGDEPAPPSSVNDRCPPKLDHAIEQALAREKTDRYRAISDFEQVLNEIRTEQSIIPNHQQSRGWRMVQGSPTRTGNAPNATPPTQSVTLNWKFEGSVNVSSSPAVVNGTVYVGSNDGKLYAVNEKDGTQQWQFDTGDGVIWSPTVVDGTVYVGSNDETLYAVDVMDGTLQWQFETGFNVRPSPAVVDGSVYVGSTDAMYSVNASDGTKQWQFDTGYGFQSSTVISPAVADSIVYAGGINADDCKLYALDATDGTEQWQFDADSRWGIISPPTVVDDTVYAVGGDNNLYAVNAANGTEQWQFETGAVLSTPAVADGKIYAGGSNSLYAVNAADGTEQWQFETGETMSSPAVADGTVYAGSEGNNVYAVDATDGTKHWQFETGGRQSSLALANRTVYFASNDGFLYALQ